MIGLSPLDGITDAAFRQIVDEIGKPDILFTEFIPVAGLSKGRTILLKGLSAHNSKTPIIAQFFGKEPDYFYNAFFIAATLGFDGVDVNMGCPDTSVVKKGGGAGLINTPKIAQQIIKVLQNARADFEKGKQLSDIEISDEMKTTVLQMASSRPRHKRHMTISIKTRIGFDTPITEKWIGQLLEVSPDFITVHGRIFTQKYGGRADWEEIHKAVKIAKKTHTKIIGNGDVHSVEEAHEKQKQYEVEGILIGRAALGNPWLFANRTPSIKERKETILRHAKLFLDYRPELDLRPMRKHFAWYCKQEMGNAQLRKQMMGVTTLDDLLHVFEFTQK